jgi:ABC-2 type transport system ATP-binding protein
VVRALDSAGITVEDVQVRPPSLDDVFLKLTGTTTTGPDVDAVAAGVSADA